MENITLNTDRVGLMDEQFFLFCLANKGLNIERNHNRQIIITAPTGLETSSRNNKIAYQLENWNEKNGLGLTFDSNADFTLHDGSVLSPDASWIAKERWSQVPSDDALLTFARILWWNCCRKVTGWKIYGKRCSSG